MTVTELNGMEISEKYYEEYGRDLIKSVMGENHIRAAAGLAGEGSQAFMLDDEISRDHDWTPGFAIWLCKEDFNIYGEELNTAYWEKFNEIFINENFIITDKSRSGVIETGDFYFRYLGLEDSPEENIKWLFLKESQLAVATNGKVFSDEMGEFTRIRENFLKFYPEDVLKKKIAARLMTINQAGEYNMARIAQRGDETAFQLAKTELITATLSLIYLINKKYMPFYKWSYKKALELNKLSEVVAAVPRMAKWEIKDYISYGKEELTKMSGLILGELRANEYIGNNIKYLDEAGESIQASVFDKDIKGLPVMWDIGY